MRKADSRQHPSEHVSAEGPLREPALDSIDGPPMEPTLSEHLDAYEATAPHEPEEIDPEAQQMVFLIVSVVLGITGAIGLASIAVAVVWML